VSDDSSLSSVNEQVDVDRVQLDLFDDELTTEFEDDLSFGDWVEQLPVGGEE
jgi:hypothetical protein